MPLPEQPSDSLLTSWLEKHLSLLHAELQAEREETKLLLGSSPPKLLERNGLALLGLGVQSRAMGLGGKMLLTLHRPTGFHSTHLLPPHTFRPGDICLLQDEAGAGSGKGKDKGAASASSAKPSDSDLEGVVFKVSDSAIVVAVGKGRSKKGAGAAKSASDSKSKAKGEAEGSSDVGEMDIPARIRLVKAANEATFERMHKTLLRLARMMRLRVKDPLEKEGGGGDSDTSGDEASKSSAGTDETPSPLILSLLARAPPEWLKKDTEGYAAALSPDADGEGDEEASPGGSTTFNASQRHAISFARRAQHFALIHGPPGTGKTTVVAEFVRSLFLEPLPSEGDAGKRLKVLVCGASNLAADNLMERILGDSAQRDRLKQAGVRVTRIGHPARVLPSLTTSTLDYQSAHSSSASLLQDISSELNDLMEALQPSPSRTSERPRSKLKGSERRSAWENVRALRREYRKRERGLMGEVVKAADVVVATCHGAGGRVLDRTRFDVVVIDEACQALEAACWIPIMRAKVDGRLILAGDHLQLPPTVKGYRHSTQRGGKKGGGGKKKGGDAGKKGGGKDVKEPDQAAGEVSADEDSDSEDEQDAASPSLAFRTGLSAPTASRPATLRPPRSLETTLFSRLLGLYGPDVKALLRVQYRMNDDIMSFPNEALYGGELRAHASVREGRVADLHGVKEGRDEAEEEVWGAPVAFIDTSAASMYETEGGSEASNSKLSRASLSTESKSNENEAVLVSSHVGKLISHGIPAESIVVLSPYSAQVSLLSSSLRPQYPGIEVGTVDGMQGREADAVILSLVRSNEKHEVGFLREKRRLNVAMTRAKRHLCVVGDSNTVGEGGDEYLEKWVRWLEDHALVDVVLP